MPLTARRSQTPPDTSATGMCLRAPIGRLLVVASRVGVTGPQQLLVDLAGDKHRQLVGHEHVPRCLEPGQPRPYVLLQVNRLYDRAGRGDDDRADRLAPLV